MSDGKTHRRIGMVAGGTCAAVRARNESTSAVFLETLGGVLGGNLGARMPDIIDPPTHPGHRSIAHGVVPAGAAGVAFAKALDGFQVRVRAEAARHAALRAEATTTMGELWHLLLEMVCRLASGAAAGFGAGYASHLILDARTPAGLPLIA